MPEANKAGTGGRSDGAHVRAFRGDSDSRAWPLLQASQQKTLQTANRKRPDQPSSEGIDQASEFMGKARAWSPVLLQGLNSAQKGRWWTLRGSRLGEGGLELTVLDANICARWGGRGGDQEASWDHESDLLLPSSPREQTQAKVRTRK